MTAIPYLNEVWNVTTGCGDDVVSPGCLNCYARRMFGRNLWKCPACAGSGTITRFPCGRCHGTGAQNFRPTFHADRLEQPLHWRKPLRIGVSFMGDLFHEAITDEQLDNVFRVIAACQHHTFLTLTKRPDRQADYLQREAKRPGSWVCEYGPLPNLWPGVTICNQEEDDRNIPILLATPAAKRWVSLEPMLSVVDMTPWLTTTRMDPKAGLVRRIDRNGNTRTTKLDLVVLGGETGPGARPMQPEWALDVYRQCKAAGVAFWFKSMGTAPHKKVWDWPNTLGAEMQATHELPAVRP